MRPAVRNRAVLAAALALVLAASSTPVSAQPPATPHRSGPQLERLDRGLVAARTSEGVFLSWRLLRDEVSGATSDGLQGPAFHVYRGRTKIATVTDSTNYLDRDGVVDATYRVVPVVRGRELDRSATVRPWAQNHVDLPLRKPADGVTPAGEAYTYSANDLSVGDVDGDGSYEYVVKWDPSNSKDVSQVGYTGPVLVDTYRADGALISRVDLGKNIRAGAHYTQFMVYDFDGDGRSEMMLKTAPGTKIIRYDSRGRVASQRYLTMPRRDVRAGFSHADDYRLSAADYYEHLVRLFRGWQRHPEVRKGNWPQTLEQAFGIAKRYAYPLSDTDARALVDYLMDVYAPARSARNNLRAFEGFILDGPEYLSVISGTGRELATVDYEPGRHDDGLMWGDYALSRIEPGNRVDRFLAGVAYLDGKRPSAVFARGYYTRANLVAYDWNGRKLKQRWKVDSGWVPMTNPFNDSPHGRDGTDPAFKTLTTQGFHSLSAADVDGDGKQEIVYGAATIDDDGSLAYSSFATLPPGSADPGARARLGHGDAMHVADLDPSTPGLEIYTVHEGATSAPYGFAFREASSGAVRFGGYTGKDTGRGMVGDIDPTRPGLENWAVDVRTAKGEVLDRPLPGTNQSIRWAADLTTQILNGSGDQTPTIQDAQRGTLLEAEGTRTNNGTKGTAGLVADVLGDWREELLVRTADSSAIRIYLSTEVTTHRLYTLMQDPQYRVEVARQNTTYNQPSYPSFYLGSDIDWTMVPTGRR